MARTKGTLSLPFNIEPEIAAPVDARFIVNELADLTLAITWTANDGNVYAYKGMVVSVHSDAISSNNGIYQLQDVDYTNINNWVKASLSGGVTDHALLSNKAWDVSGHTKGITEKTNPVGTDVIAIFDSENSFAPAYMSLANLASFLGYNPPIDTFYIMTETGNTLTTEAGDILRLE